MVGARLDCYSVEIATASLAEAAGVAQQDLVAAIHGFNEPEDWGSRNPFEELPRLLFNELGVEFDALAFNDACYFHGTRVDDPDRLRREGVRPLSGQTELLWDFLYRLVADDVTAEEWAAFRYAVENGNEDDDGRFYRHRMSYSYLDGPYGLVVREFLLGPEAVFSHDYLACPESVMDISRAFQRRTGIDLQARFLAATVPCIVKFRSDELKPGAVCAATWYAYTKLRDRELTTNGGWGPRGEGDPVLAADVLDVEIMQPAPGGVWEPSMDPSV